jgi:hypothetical protein
MWVGREDIRQDLMQKLELCECTCVRVRVFRITSRWREEMQLMGQRTQASISQALPRLPATQVVVIIVVAAVVVAADAVMELVWH